jgi:hypothetical protein
MPRSDDDFAASAGAIAPRTSAQIAHTRTTETLDLVSTNVIETCDELIRELIEIKEFMIQDCGRVKAEVAAHVDSAGAMKQQTESIRGFIAELKVKRIEMIRARIQ